MAKHVCPNRFGGEGAKGACYFSITGAEEKDAGGDPMAYLDVGWSCVVVGPRKPIPISWLAELIAIATAHAGGIAGFLKEHDYGGESYALFCDPPQPQQEPTPNA